MTWTEQWTDSAVDRLRTLWDAGMSTAKIAQALGVSKNAIVGKANRLKLTSRPSPIGRGPRARPVFDKSAVLQMLNSGVSREEAAARAGVSQHQIDLVRTEFNLPTAQEIARILSASKRAQAEAKRTVRRPPALQLLSTTETVIVIPRSVTKPAQIIPHDARCTYLQGERPWIRCDAPAGPEHRSWCSFHVRRVFVQRGEAA